MKQGAIPCRCTQIKKGLELIYKWKLKKLDVPENVFQEGEIEAENQNEAVDKLRDQNIRPHAGELLEIISPMDNTTIGKGPIILT